MAQCRIRDHDIDSGWLGVGNGDCAGLAGDLLASGLYSNVEAHVDRARRLYDLVDKVLVENTALANGEITGALWSIVGNLAGAARVRSVSTSRGTRMRSGMRSCVRAGVRAGVRASSASGSSCSSSGCSSCRCTGSSVGQCVLIRNSRSWGGESAGGQRCDNERCGVTHFGCCG